MIGNEFTCNDRTGRPVSCSRECWAKHIIIHPEMVGQQRLVRIIIEKPITEYQDARNVDTRSLYKSLVLPQLGNTLVKVSVRYFEKFGKVRGTVKTAYATDKVKKGEVWLWGQKFVS